LNFKIFRFVTDCRSTPASSGTGVVRHRATVEAAGELSGSVFTQYAVSPDGCGVIRFFRVGPALHYCVTVAEGLHIIISCYAVEVPDENHTLPVFSTQITRMTRMTRIFFLSAQICVIRVICVLKIH
jgi:hypothetical protein